MSQVTLLDKSKTLTELAADKTDGLGILQCTKATVTEELNGSYLLSFNISILEKHFSDLTAGSIVRAKPNDTSKEQLWKVYSISKPMLGIVSVEAKHISYDLLGAAVIPFKATGISQTATKLKQNVQGNYPFTFKTDIQNTTSEFEVIEPISYRNALGGVEGSVLDVFGGEYEWDNLTVNLKQTRGSDNGVTIEYGKNLTDATQEQNIEDMYTGVLGYATKSGVDTGKVDADGKTITEDVVYYGTVQTNIATDTPRTKIIDFSDEFDKDDTPTASRLNALAYKEAVKSSVKNPQVSLTVKFTPLAQTEEYKNIAPLETVSLGDTVHVYFSKLGIKAEARVVKYSYDVLNDRYNSIELGDKKSTLSKTVVGKNKELTRSISSALAKADKKMEAAIEHATDLITGGLGGHLVIGTDKAGHPNELLIMDTSDKETAKYVLRINLNGIGFSSKGYNGPFTTAWTLDGSFVANFIRSGTLDADLITVTNLQAESITAGTINNNRLGGQSTGGDNGDITAVNWNGYLLHFYYDHGLATGWGLEPSLYWSKVYEAYGGDYERG